MTRLRKIAVLAVLALSLMVAPGAAPDPFNQDPSECCYGCAYHEFTFPNGEVRREWICLAFDCANGYQDCWEHVEGTQPCFLMWHCDIF